MNLRGGAFTGHGKRQHGGGCPELAGEMSRDAILVDRVLDPDDHGWPGAGERHAEGFGNEPLHSVEEWGSGGTKRLVQPIAEGVP